MHPAHRAAGLLIVGAVWLLGCADTPTPREDLPDEKVMVEQGERLVYLNPDQFPNVVVWCDGNTRIYVTTRETQPIEVVPDHPLCER